MHENASLRLWKYNQITGLWDYQRTVTEETQDKWLGIFRQDEPGEYFKISRSTPRFAPDVMHENAKSGAIWEKGTGPQSVTSWGEHPWSWWRKKVAGYRGDSPPKLTIVVRAWDASGQPVRSRDFEADDLRGAKQWAKQRVEDAQGSAEIIGRVYIFGEGDFTADSFGEYRIEGPKEFYIWQVERDYRPINYRGPFQDRDETRRLAYGVANQAAYNQVVTFGNDPTQPGFYVDRVYRAGSGEVFTTSMMDQVAARLGEYRGNPEYRSGRMRVDYDDTSTRYVLAGAYHGRDIGNRELLTHLVFMKGDGELLRDVRTACSQDVDNVADLYSVTPGEEHARPTCPRCAKAFDKIYSERAPNGSGYYVWLLDRSNRPLTTEGPYGPYHTLEGAKPFARISATNGKHDRAISRGRDPRGEDFEIVRKYQARSGVRII